VASEYSVNIKLNTAQVKRDLKTIGDGIGNLNKKQGRGSKAALSDAEQALKVKITQLGFDNKILKIQNTLGVLTSKDVNQKKVMNHLNDAQLKSNTKQFSLAKQSILLAQKEIQKQKETLLINKSIEDSIKKQNLLRGRPTGFSAAQYGPQLKGFGEMQGPRLPPITSSALNFDRTTGRLLQGPAGSSRNTRQNLLRRFGPTRGFDFGSAAISGGFPLLFGQGPLGALAGGLGGGIGGMFGQMGGFAGGIAATAILQQVQNIIGSMSNLGQAFNLLTPDIDGLTAALGANGTEREKQIQLIKKTEGTQAALAAVTAQMNDQIGEKGVKNLKEFGETTRLIGNAFSLLGTKMLAALAPVINLLATPLTAEATRAETNRLANVGGANTDEELQTLQTRLNNVGRGRSANKQRDRIRAQIEARKEELAIIGKGIERQKTINLVEDSRLNKIRQQNALLQAKINGNHEEVLLAQQVNEIAKGMLEDGLTDQDIDRKKIENLLVQNNLMEKQAQQAEKVKQQFASLGQSLATDVADGLQGIIRGTSTLNDMLNNVLNKLIDAAFNMAFFGNPGGQMGGGGGLFGSIFGGLGSIFGGKKGPFGGAPLGPLGNPLSQHTDLTVGVRAGGGSVKGGSGYLVGERGPEMFTPGVSGMITPNHALGGSTTVIVNVDATGSSVEGDEEQGRQLGRLISAAVQSEIIQQKRPGGILA